MIKVLAVIIGTWFLVAPWVIAFFTTRANGELRERLEWLEVQLDQSPASNWNMCVQLEKQVRRLNRRVANLLDSPKTYLRARRIAGTLDLPIDELTAELELFILVEAEQAMVAT